MIKTGIIVELNGIILEQLVWHRKLRQKTVKNVTYFILRRYGLTEGLIIRTMSQAEIEIAEMEAKELMSFCLEG